MSEAIKCIIVDDEPMALALLESYVLKTPFLQLVQKCSNAFEVIKIINEQQIDLIFLDIQMPDLTGIELSKTLPKQTRIIFTTAFNEYALEGFKAQALDYLMKPFGYDQFYNAALRAKEWFSLLENKSVNTVIVNQEVQAALAKDFIFVKSEYRQLKIMLDDVLYFEGLKDYIKIWLVKEPKPILTLMSLKSVTDNLPSDKFMRIHRSYIIALDKIDKVERNQAIIGDKRITVADQYKDVFHDYIKNMSIN